MDSLLKHLPKGGHTITRKPLVPSKAFQEAMKHFDIRDQRIRDQAIELVKRRNELILETLKKAGADTENLKSLAKDCVNYIIPGGKEILHYKGKGIIEFYPPGYSFRREGMSFYSDSGFSYRILI